MSQSLPKSVAREVPSGLEVVCREPRALRSTVITAVPENFGKGKKEREKVIAESKFSFSGIGPEPEPSPGAGRRDRRFLSPASPGQCHE